MVKHGVNAIFLIDVLNPFWRHSGVLAQYVHPHIFQQGHLGVERRHDDIVGLFPQAVRVVGTNGEVIPVHTVDEEVVSIDHQLHPLPVITNGNLVSLGQG